LLDAARCAPGARGPSQGEGPAVGTPAPLARDAGTDARAGAGLPGSQAACCGAGAHGGCAAATCPPDAATASGACGAHGACGGSRGEGPGLAQRGGRPAAARADAGLQHDAQGAPCAGACSCGQAACCGSGAQGGGAATAGPADALEARMAAAAGPAWPPEPELILARALRTPGASCVSRLKGSQDLAAVRPPVHDSCGALGEGVEPGRWPWTASGVR